LVNGGMEWKIGLIIDKERDQRKRYGNLIHEYY
jgi:hypothetical protein